MPQLDFREAPRAKTLVFLSTGAATQAPTNSAHGATEAAAQVGSPGDVTKFASLNGGR